MKKTAVWGAEVPKMVMMEPAAAGDEGEPRAAVGTSANQQPTAACERRCTLTHAGAPIGCGPHPGR